MMEEEFDLKEIGKQMPYKVPAAFFDTITTDTLAQAEKRAAGKKKHTHLWRSLSVAASILVLLVAGYFVYTGRTPENEMMAQTAPKESPAAATSIALPAPETPGQPALAAQEQPVPAAAPVRPAKTRAAGTAKAGTSQGAVTPEPETLEEILASISDEELLQLAALAESELYVYEESYSNE